MNKRSSTLGVIAAGVLTAAALAASPLIRNSAGDPATPSMASHWVDTWVSMPQLTEPGNMPPAPFTQDNRVLANSTVRQTIHTSVGGQHMRLRFSNAFGGVDLPITSVSVALPLNGRAGVSAIQAGTTQPVTVYLADGQASNSITSHPGSRTTSYLLAGNHVADSNLPSATPVDHWYFLSGLEVWSKSTTTGVAVLGDSLTDGRGSTTNMNNRWPDQLLQRLQSHPDTADVAVLNQAAGGNRVLHDGLGPNGLARLDRDVLAQTGIQWLIVFEGVNDIGTADATEPAQKQVAADLIAAYDQIVTRAHAKGIRVYGATITPFGGNTGYDDAQGLREAARQTVNDWIRTSHRFDAVIDFDLAVRDPQNPRQILPACDA